MRNFPAKTLRKTTTTCSLCAHSVPLWGTSSSSCANPCPLVCPPHAGCRIPCRTFARHPRPTHRVGVHGADLCGHSITHRNLLPVRRGTPAMRPSLSQRSCTADSLSNNRRSTLWKLRRTLPICLRIIWGTTCPESDRRRILLNCL